MLKINVETKPNRNMTCGFRIEADDEYRATRELMAATLQIRDALLDIVSRERADNVLALFAKAITEGEQPNPSHDEEAEEKEE